jgi:hypothetical protein
MYKKLLWHALLSFFNVFYFINITLCTVQVKVKVQSQGIAYGISSVPVCYQSFGLYTKILMVYLLKVVLSKITCTCILHFLRFMPALGYM